MREPRAPPFFRLGAIPIQGCASRRDATKKYAKSTDFPTLRLAIFADIAHNMSMKKNLPPMTPARCVILSRDLSLPAAVRRQIDGPVAGGRFWGPDWHPGEMTVSVEALIAAGCAIWARLARAGDAGSVSWTLVAADSDIPSPCEWFEEYENGRCGYRAVPEFYVVGADGGQQLATLSETCRQIGDLALSLGLAPLASRWDLADAAGEIEDAADARHDDQTADAAMTLRHLCLAR